MTVCVNVPGKENFMNLEKLTERQREIYTQVEDYRKTHPDASNMHILKELQLNPSTYAAARKIMREDSPEEIPQKRKYTRRTQPIQQMFNIPVEEASQPPFVVAFVGDSASVVKSVNEFLRGNK